jgi:thiol-disulfide isomerase/thioredoxin
MTASQLPVTGRLPALDGATAWLNSRPLTTDGLRGKVVVIDFWTYTCINWIRTLPYVRAWAGKYKDHGLEVIGVHTPEFRFEASVDNIREAIKDMGVSYPVAIDSDYAVWNAFGNHYWPALYFADAQGNLRHHYFGEGDYEQSELVIRQLLTEAGAGGLGPDLVAPEVTGVEVAADWSTLESAETYAGYQRAANFASPGGQVPGEAHAYAVPAQLEVNHWALSGDWTAGPQAASLNTAGGRIAYRFHARDLHLILGPAVPGAAVRFQVRLDGQPPGEAHGIDIDGEGNGTVTHQRMYQLIRQPGLVTERTFQITFLDPGAEAYAFTFG